MTALIRSFLFVPGDSERKIEKSQASNADALVFDLEDSVAQARKPIARTMVANYLRTDAAKSNVGLWVRINPLTSSHALLDLAAVVGGRPTGLLLPKAESPDDVQLLSTYLDALEINEGVEPGSIKILPVATETAHAPLTLHLYPRRHLPRLFGLTWGAEDLSSALGAAANTDEDGRLSLTYRMARSLTLLAAKATGVEAIDTVYPNFRDIGGLTQSSKASYREGFSGRFAIHPDQVDVINAAFSPSESDIAFAVRVVEAFDSDPDAGVVAVDGRMLDLPHLKQARTVLAMRDAVAQRSTV
jgi:citrate lyase subunit beta/citryl-CoA lyase